MNWHHNWTKLNFECVRCNQQVTGGGNGIGKSIAFRLAEEGCKIAIVDIENDAAMQTADELTNLHVECRAYCVSFRFLNIPPLK